MKEMKEIKEILKKILRPILNIKYGDKILYFTVFGILGLISLWLPRESVISIAMFSAFLGIIFKMILHFLSWSLFSWEDVAVCWLGGFTFGYLYFVTYQSIPFYIAIY